jgi:hypothetical protein
VQVVDTLAPLLPRAAVGTPKGPDAQADLKAKLLKDDACVPLSVPLSQMLVSTTAPVLGCCDLARTPRLCSRPLILSSVACFRDLNRLYEQLVLSGVLGAEEFWRGRSHLLKAGRVTAEQRVGLSSAMLTEMQP